MFWLAAEAGSFMAARLERTDARFARAIVARRSDRRGKQRHPLVIEKQAGGGGLEWGAVVALENDGWGMLREEGRERLIGGLGALIGGRQREQLPAAGQVSDGEDVGVRAVDRMRDIGKVHGPDGPRRGPTEARDGAAARPEAVTAKEVLQFAPSDFRELGAQRADTDAWAGLAQVGKDFSAVEPVQARRRPAARRRDESVRASRIVAESLHPVAQSSRRKTQGRRDGTGTSRRATIALDGGSQVGGVPTSLLFRSAPGSLPTAVPIAPTGRGGMSDRWRWVRIGLFFLLAV